MLVSPDEVDLLLVIACKDGRNELKALAESRKRSVEEVFADVQHLKDLNLVTDVEGKLFFNELGYASLLSEWFSTNQSLSEEEKKECDVVFFSENFQVMLSSFVGVQGVMLADEPDGFTWFGTGVANRKTFQEVFLTPINMFIVLSRLHESQFSTLTFSMMQLTQKKIKGLNGMLVNTSLLSNQDNLRKLSKYQKFYPKFLDGVMKRVRGLG